MRKVSIIKRPIICFPAIDWQYLFHRPQQLMLGFSRMGHPVHVKNPCRIPGAAPEEVAPNLRTYYDFDQIPPEVAETAIYFLYLPMQALQVVPTPAKFIVYDCIDDDPSFTGQEDLMLSRADLVLCVSEPLMQKHRNRHHCLLFLPNGVDGGHYSAQGSLPDEIEQLKTGEALIIGFSGAFYNGWVDTELFYDLARVNPQWHMVIVGESYQWDFSGAPPNIHYLGRKSYQELPSYLRGFDIGLIPFLDNQIARGADPVKLYEYIAAGLPVISRDLPFVRQLAPPLVYTYKKREECVNAINRALSGPREKALPLRNAFTLENSWDSRIERLMAELTKLTRLD